MKKPRPRNLEDSFHVFVKVEVASLGISLVEVLLFAGNEWSLHVRSSVEGKAAYRSLGFSSEPRVIV